MAGQAAAGAGAGEDGERRAALYREFRPRRARRVAYGVAVGALVTMGVLAFASPVPLGPLDQAGFVAVGVAVAWFMHRQGSVVAVPSPSGLRVRNLLLSRELEWAQVVAVRFGQGRPWAQLDLADGDTLAVMAVQQADGARATAEATRLATLVELHSRTARDD